MNKPHVILNSAMTLDGKIATNTGSSEISGIEDMERVHKIRQDSDAIMVGINTVMADDPRLTVHKIPSKMDLNPIRVVVDSKGQTPLKSRILNNEAPTIIAVSKRATSDRIKLLEELVEVEVCGGERVDLSLLMEKLAKRGVKTLMLEGGATLNFSMFKEGLVDEIRVCIAPMIVGGYQAKTLVDGSGIDDMGNAVPLKLIKHYLLGKDLIVEYKVIKS
jgi:2,5-diamino-6-(ribosylamino)-4(3H)-pyrimidinone 5'-phosphate reductase